MICSECQTANREGANFCRRCGHLLGDLCPRCDTSLLPDSDFCDHCGLPLAPAVQGWPIKGMEPDAGMDEHEEHIRGGDRKKRKSRQEPPVSRESPSQAQESPPLDRFIPAALREKLEYARSQGEIAGERRIVTMLFCDVKGSTAAAQHLDPEEWTEIINGAFEHMIRPVYKYEGTVARLMGDGLLAFFGAPIAHEDDPKRGVLAGLEIVEQIAGYRVQIQETWGIELNVRVGINTGLVVVGTVGSDLRMEYTAMGDAINLAARMEQTAEPGTVQIGHDTYKLVKSLFEFADLGEIVVKGKAEPVPAYRVLGLKVAADRQRGIEGLQEAFAGRDAELAALTEILSAAWRSGGRIVGIPGDAGLGKSRLIREARRSLGNGGAINWVETTSLSYESSQPYAPFQRLIRRLATIGPGDSQKVVREKLAVLCQPLDGALGDRAQGVLQALFDLEREQNGRLEGEAFKHALFEILPALWRGLFSGQTAVLVFEDLHWSDPASIELLLHLFPMAADLSLVWLCAFRPEKSGPSWQLKTAVEGQFDHLYTEIKLSPLADHQVNALIDGLLGPTALPDSLKRRILEHAGGNPFFVEEVIRSLIERQAIVRTEREHNGRKTVSWRTKGQIETIAIPDSLQSLVSSRIDRLDEETRHVLETAAVIGRTFYRRVLEAILGQEQNDRQGIGGRLDRLLQMEMIREATKEPEIEYRFSNPLTQEVAYQTILWKRRRVIHQQVGQVLESIFPEQLGEMAPLLAHHFSESNQPKKAFDYSVKAGESASRLFANIEALDHFSRARKFLEQVDPDSGQMEVLFSGRGRALELLSRYEEALENYEAMLELAHSCEDHKLALAAKMAMATIRSIPSKVFDPEISLKLSKEARDLAHEIGAHPAEAKINWNLMLHYQWAEFDFEQAARHGEAAIEVLRKSGDTIEEGPVLNDLALALFGVGRLERSLEAFEESRELLRSAENLPLLALNLTSSSTVQFLIGNDQQAQALMDEAEHINRSIENYWGLAGSFYYRGQMLWVNGRWAEARKAVDGAIEYCELAQAHMLLAASLIGKANYRLSLGDFENGMRYCRRGLEFFEQHLPALQGYPWGVMSMLFLASGDRTAAQEAFLKSQENFDLAQPPTPTFGPIELRLAEIKLRLDEGANVAAARIADDLIAYLDRFHIRQFHSEALWFKAKALLAENRTEAACSFLEEASRMAQELSTLPVLWRILDTQAQALEQIGKVDLAKSKMDAARVVLRSLADSIPEEDRSAFTNLPDVRRVLGSRG